MALQPNRKHLDEPALVQANVLWHVRQNSFYITEGTLQHMRPILRQALKRIKAVNHLIMENPCQCSGAAPFVNTKIQNVAVRSEERRVGKEWVSQCRYRWWRYH